MLVASNSFMQQDGNDVKTHETRHFRIHRNLAMEENCLVIRAYSSY
jgi:hypothetical protein